MMASQEKAASPGRGETAQNCTILSSQYSNASPEAKSAWLSATPAARTRALVTDISPLERCKFSLDSLSMLGTLDELLIAAPGVPVDDQGFIDALAAEPARLVSLEERADEAMYDRELAESHDRRYSSEVSIIRGCDLSPEAVKWLWPGWLAAGKLHILGGAPGTGKTTLALAMAAAITTGGRWPDGTRAPLGNVVVWSGEDDPTDTLLPRLILSGADVNRIYFVGDVFDIHGKRAFDPAKDMRPLSDALDGIGDVRLLIVDPIVSAVAGDSHKNAEVRRGLQPLVDLAVSMRCALLGITHFSKGTGGREPLERVTGSLAFGALARVVLVAAKHQEQGADAEPRRVLLRAKSNIGPDTGGFEYELRQDEVEGYPGLMASSAVFGQAIEGAARDILAEADATDSDSEGDSLTDAKRFLLDLLADGPQPTKAIKSDADGAGYSWATIRRAQKSLGIDSTREGGIGKAGSWRWSLPRTGEADHLDSPKVLKNCLDAQQNNVSTLEKSERLRTGNVASINSDTEVF